MVVTSNFFPIYFMNEKFEDTKGVIRIRKWKKDRQHNGQKKEYKRTNNDLQPNMFFFFQIIIQSSFLDKFC